MRAIGAVVLAIMIIFIGIVALSTIADTTEDAAIQNGTNASADAYNATTQVLEGVGPGLVNLLVYGGIGAALLATLGFLVIAGSKGR